MGPRQDLIQCAADLYSLAFLITRDTDASIEIATEALALQNSAASFFSDQTRRSARKLVIAEALAAIADEIPASARRVARSRWQEPDFAPGSGAFGHDMTKAELERALLAIDVFPRCVLLICIFEGLAQPEAAVLMGLEPELVALGQAVGLCELSRNIGNIRIRANDNVASHAFAAELAPI